MTTKRVPNILLAAGLVALICAGSAALESWRSVLDLPQNVQLASASAAQPLAPYTFDGTRIVRR